MTYQLELHDTYQDFTANQRSDAESRVSVAVTSLSDGSLQAQALARRSLFGGLEMDTFSNIATVVGVSGSEFAISNTSLAQCTANPDPGMASSQCDVNFSDTSYFTLDPVTAGASYLTGSGIDYRASAFPAAQQTPEPCSAVLFGFGFFAFFLRRTISVKNTVD